MLYICEKSLEEFVRDRSKDPIFVRSTDKREKTGAFATFTTGVFLKFSFMV